MNRKSRPADGRPRDHNHDRATPHANLHVEPVLAVRPFGHGLIEAAVLGLRKPVGREHDLLQGLRAGGQKRDERDEHRANALPHADRHGTVLLFGAKVPDFRNPAMASVTHYATARAG